MKEPAAELITALALPAAAAADDSRPLWPASPSAGWASGVDRLTGLPNGRTLAALRPFMRAPSAEAALGTALSVEGAPTVRGRAAAAPAPAAAAGPCGVNCTRIPGATTPYNSPSDVTLNASSPEACCALCAAAPPENCAVALWDGLRCFLRADARLDHFWASDALWPDRSGPLPPIPADFHGPYYSPGGSPTVNSPSGGPAAWLADVFPAAFAGAGSAPLGANAPGLFNSEFGVTGPVSFESLSPALSPADWGVRSSAMFWRNYACDGALAAYFPMLPAGFADARGEAAFKGQLFLCAVAQAAKLALVFEPARAGNFFGNLIWQLNEIW